jgi:deoxyribonuclease V
VLAAGTAFARVLAERTVALPLVPPYRPGEFYRRELPRLRAALDDLRELGLLVAGGYADLGPGGRPGLGAHAHAAFGILVIGVAKSRFSTTTHAVPVVRGSSVHPCSSPRPGCPRRRGRPGPAHGWPVPAGRRAVPMRPFVDPW